MARRNLRGPGAREEGVTGRAREPGVGTAPVTPAPAPQGPADWLGLPDVPPEVAVEIDRIFRTTPDVNQASMIALAYLRGTDWYRQAYVGIEAGRRLGIIGNEGDYRSYVNQVQQHYRAYNGRDATGAEIQQWLASGWTPETVGRKLQGASYVASNRAEIQYLTGAFSEGQLSEQELTAYGEQQSGLGSALGSKLLPRVEAAIQKAQRVAQGVLATDALGMDSLQQTQLRRRKPDISA